MGEKEDYDVAETVQVEEAGKCKEDADTVGWSFTLRQEGDRWEHRGTSPAGSGQARSRAARDTWGLRAKLSGASSELEQDAPG